MVLLTSKRTYNPTYNLLTKSAEPRALKWLFAIASVLGLRFGVLSFGVEIHVSGFLEFKEIS